MRRSVKFGIGIALLAASTHPVSAASPLSGYRCAGTGALMGSFYQEYDNWGWQWKVTGDVTCALSPGGRWQGSIAAKGYPDECGGRPNLARSPLILSPGLYVELKLTNPKTGKTRELLQLWKLQSKRLPESSSVFYLRSADVPAYRMTVHPVADHASACNGEIGEGDGAGVLIRVLSAESVISELNGWSEQLTDTVVFALNAPTP